MILTLGHFLSLGAMLFALSVVGIFLNRRNLIVLLMAIELMLLAVNTNFVAFSHYLHDMHGAVLAGVFGTKFGGNWIGRKLSHSLTILGVFVAFVLSAMTLMSVVNDGARFNETIYTWMVVGGLKMEIGFLIDSL
eukprot:gene34962-biopygen27687